MLSAGMRRFCATLLDLWATRSLLIGGLSALVDLTTVVVLVEAATWPRVPAAVVGVAVGGIIGFVLNKYVAFRDQDPNIGRQFARFSAGMGLAMVLHAGVMAVLTHGAGVHYVVSKLVADVAVFTGGQLLLLRYVIFPRARKVLVEAIVHGGNRPGESTVQT